MNKSSKSIAERVIAEKTAHENHDVLAESYRVKERFGHIWHYPSRKRLLDEGMSHQLTKFTGKIVLDYGCGRGEASLLYLEHGATVYGIDIAQNYIEDAANKATELGYSPQRFKFEVMDAHKLTYPSDTFDIVVGNGILHHLEPDVALAEIYRVLKPGGRVLMQEPLEDNPLLKLFRWLTPKARTDDERPFTRGDIARMMDPKKWMVETGYCGVIEAPVAVVTSVILPKWPNNWLLKLADVVERWLHKHKILLSWNQYILFNMIKKPLE